MHYLSPNHCKEDPGGMIGDALAMGKEFPGPAHDLFLAWSLQLAHDDNIAACAACLFQRYPVLKEHAKHDNAIGTLARLLLQAQQADPTSCKTSRRGGTNRKGGKRGARQRV